MGQQKLQPLPEAQRRDFVDVMWLIAEKRCCDEVVVRYDCGHAMRVDVWIPVLPKTREYANQEADRRRFMQHSIFVLTKNPGAPKVQVTVPEGRCRHCGRGNRQALVCGLLQMDLTESAEANAPAARAAEAARAKGGGRGQAAQAAQAATLAGVARRLELPLSSHVFLAAMGQVCRLPDNITLPPLLQSSSALQSGALKPSDGPPLSQGGLHQWSRKEIEDELKAAVVKYVGGATFLLMFVVIECLYLCVIHFGPSSRIVGGAAADNVSRSVSGELGGLASVGAIEMGIANTTWVLSALTLTVHKTFGPADATLMDGSLWWTMVVHPLWILVSILLAPLLWVLDLVVAVPRFLLLHVVFALVHALLWRLRHCSWFFSTISEGFNSCASFLFRGIFARPTIMLSQIPMTNPMVVAMVLSLLMAAFSAPQPPSLSLPSFWSDIPNLEVVQRLRSLWGSEWQEGRQKGSRQGAPSAKGQKEKPQKEKGGAEPSSRPEKAQEGRQKGSQSAPACFVCLDRPSRYILEPCGHKVVCGECAVPLVEAAARNRQAVEVLGLGSHHSSEKRGGTCPSCGMAITRAMRVFSSPGTLAATCRTASGNGNPPPRGCGSGARR